MAAKRKFGHNKIATQHLLLALLTPSGGWFQRKSELRVPRLLLDRGITLGLAENKTRDGIITPTTGVLDDRVVSLNAQITALAEILIKKRLFTRTEFVAVLDQSEGPLAPDAFLLPLIEALSRKKILLAEDETEIAALTAKAEPPKEKTAPDEGESPVA